MAAEQPAASDAALDRLREWSQDELHVARSVRSHEPTYANPAALRTDVRDALAEIERLTSALRHLGTPQAVPPGFDPLDWWLYTASKRSEFARETLGVTAEELIRDAIA